jgi:transposase
MTQIDDLSRSLITFEQNSTIVVVLEMSQSSWLAAGVVPGIERRPLKKLVPIQWRCCVCWGVGGIMR